jgi:hypothetical protein
MLQVLGTGKACQQQPLHLKYRNVLLGINCLKNALHSCVVEKHLLVSTVIPWFMSLIRSSKTADKAEIHKTKINFPLLPEKRLLEH